MEGDIIGTQAKGIYRRVREMRVGDRVRHANNPHSMICEVIEVKDLGHGRGYERVKIQLPLLGLTRYYAANELENVTPQNKRMV